MTRCLQRSLGRAPRLAALMVFAWWADGNWGATRAWAAAGQPVAEDDPADYGRLLAEAGAARPDEFELVFERVVRLRMVRERLDAPRARIAVRRDLAAAEAAKGNWAEAALHDGQALVIAQALQDADALLSLHLERAAALAQAGERWSAIDHARSAWEIARLLPRPEKQIEAGLMLAGWLYDSGRPEEAETYNRTMLTVPGADRLAIELSWARHGSGGSGAEARARWQTVADLAHDRGDAAIEARALNEIAFHHARDDETALALELFRRADRLALPHLRTTAQWETYSQALKQTGDLDGARRAIEHALAGADPNSERLAIASLHDAHAALLADAGDYRRAYAALREAQALRERPRATELRTTALRMSGVTPTRDTDQAAALAAVRNALRDAELASSRVRQRDAVAAGIAALLLATALGIAYHFKRRAAAALASARDVAELRAERTHWQMLRYQINPHFLFNALTSIRSQLPAGLVRARDAVDRLADFCRMTLHAPRSDERISLGDELNMLRAYLNIERSRLGPLLVVNFDVDESATGELLPRLLLLPLVENALKYGASTSVDRLELRIAVRRIDGDLEIEIANTGKWVDKPADRSVASLRVGHENIRDRLNRHYPGAHAFVVDARDGWVSVKLRLGRAIAAADIWADATNAARRKRFA